MPMQFDRKLEFQFALLLTGAGPRIPREALLSLPELFEPASGGEHQRVRFGDVTLEESFVQHGTQLVQLPTASWGTGPWRMTWSPIRLDVYADALVYRDIAEKRLALAAVSRRLLVGLRGAAERLEGMGALVHRLVLIVTGEAHADAVTPTVPAAVADRFLSPQICAAVREQALLDVGARVDWRTDFDLGGTVGMMPVHRIENVGTSVSFSGVTPKLGLRAQWDVNTSPARGDSPLPTECFGPFYEHAERWIAQRIQALGVEEAV